MARRRLNKNFLILAAAVAATPVAVGLAWHKLKPKDPDKLIAAGQMYLRQGDLPDAAAAYSAAAAIRPTDPDLHLKLGGIYFAMKDQGDFGGSMRSAVDEWTRAEELQPSLKAAWQGLLEANMLWAVNTAQNPGIVQDLEFLLPRQFGIARDAAQHLLVIDPNDPKAKSAIPILTINLWLLNLSIPLTAEEQALPVDQQPTAAQRIDRAVTDLTTVMRDHPEDADLPYWVARAKIGQAVKLAQQASSDSLAGINVGTDAVDAHATPNDRMAEVRALYGEAAVAFDDAIAHRPKDATLRIKKYEILTKLMQVDRSATAIAGYQRQQRDALQNAQALVSPADAMAYGNYKVAWADYVSRTDPAAAELVYKDLLKNPPGRPAGAPAGGAGGLDDAQRLMTDVQIRLQYAQMLERDQTRRGDALALLDVVPTVPPQTVPAAFQQQVAHALAIARLLRAQILTDQYEVTTSNPTLRAQLLDRAKAEIDAAAANPSVADGADVLKARGRLQLVSGAYRDAIQTLSLAEERLKASGRGTDFQLLAWEATAYADGQQTGQAIRKLEQAVQDPSGANRMQPHEMLAELYLDDQDYDKARAEVAWLAERYPDNVSTIHLQIRALGPHADPKAAAPLYDRLPERSNNEMLDKAAWAQRTHNDADAERLYEGVLKNVPGEPQTTMRVAQMYAAGGNTSRANELLQNSIDLNPDSHAAQQILKDQINRASVAVVNDETRTALLQIKDPLSRTMGLARLDAAEGNLPAQVADLEAARDVQPDNKDVLKELFLRYLDAKRLDAAAAMVPHLTALDADDTHGSIFRFRLAMAQGDVATAKAVGLQLTHDYPQFASSWTLYGEALQANGQLPEASQQYLGALDRQANNTEALQRLVECTIRLGKLDDARQYLKTARAKFPDNATYRQQQVRLEVAYGDPELVLGIVDDSVREHGDHPDAYQVAVQTYAAAAQRRTAAADAAGAAGFTDKVHDLLVTALAKWPDNAVFATELAQLQAQDGSDAGLAAAAGTVHALAATPAWANKPLPGVLMGRLYLDAKRPALAEAQLRGAIALDPSSVDARSLLADALYAQKKPQDALDVLAAVKDRSVVRSKYVDLLLTLGRGDQAESELLAELKAHPGDPMPGNLLAHVYAAGGKWDAALDVANRTLAADPKDTAAYYIKGTTEADRPDPDLDAAAKDLSVFRTAYPTNVQGRLALARVLEARHDLDGATKEVEAAVDQAPDNKEARLKLAHAYLATTPPRNLDAQRVIAQSLAMPQFAHDPDVQRVAAVVWLRQGDSQRAVNAIQDAMTHTADQRGLMDEYFNILLATRNYPKLLDESAKFLDAPNPSWTVYDFRGRARAASSDTEGAYADFATALQVAGAAPDLAPAATVAGHATELLGIDRTVGIIAPWAGNSAKWKAVLASCYSLVGDRTRALASVEGALASLDTFRPSDQRRIREMAGTLYMTVEPPEGDRALPLFKSIVDASPDDVDALNNLACVLTEQLNPPRPQEALKYSQHAFDLVRKSNVANPYIADTLGWDLILNDRCADGIAVLHQVVDEADFPDVHYHLAEGYLRKRPPTPEDAKRELNLATGMIVKNSADGQKRTFDVTLRPKIEAAQKVADGLIGTQLQDGGDVKPQASANP